MKLLIIAACTIAGEAVSTHADVGEEVDVTKDEAGTLARMGRGLYLEKADDPTKGQLTATAEDKARVKKQVAAIKAEREAREVANQAQSPAGLAGLIAATVAQAVQAALKPEGAKA